MQQQSGKERYLPPYYKRLKVSRDIWLVWQRPNCKTVYASSILVVASIHIINDLDRLYERPQETAGDQQAAYQPSGNGTRGQGARVSLAARGKR